MALWWMQQGRLHENVDDELQEGLEAYTAKQASILTQMAKSFALEWHPLLAAFNITAEWPSELLSQQDSATSRDADYTMENPEQDDIDFDMDDDMFM